MTRSSSFSTSCRKDSRFISVPIPKSNTRIPAFLNDNKESCHCPLSFSLPSMTTTAIFATPFLAFGNTLFSASFSARRISPRLSLYVKEDRASWNSFVDVKDSNDALTEVDESLKVTMEARLLFEEMPKLVAIVFKTVFSLRKLPAPMPPDPNIKVKSAEMSHGSGTEKRNFGVRGKYFRVRNGLFSEFVLRAF